MREAHLRTTCICELHLWMHPRQVFPGQLRDAWADAQRANGDGPEERYLLNLINEARAERAGLGDA